MSVKCKKCNSSQIEFVMFHDIIVEKCLDCDFYRVDNESYDKLTFNCMYDENIAEIKKYTYTSEIPKDKRKKMKKFRKFFSLSSFKLNDVCDIECNKCGSNVVEFMNKYFPSFKLYYCSFCNSIYFSRSDFDIFLENATNRIKYSLFERIKRFFIKRMKNNAKE